MYMGTTSLYFIMWSGNQEVPGPNQVDVLESFGIKDLILITKALRQELQLLVPWLVTYKPTHAFYNSSQVKQIDQPTN